jgi:L-ascorbate metabolism protein UlaG (beta-lactamase superfamily)
VTDIRITHIGGPTLLIGVNGWRLLTDPTFDPPGRTYSFGWGTGSRKLAGPAVPRFRPRADRRAIERELARAPEDIRRRIQWLPIGVEVEIAA